jgi:hypothetical protein
VYIILCADFITNYLNDNKDKQALNSLLTRYIIYSIIDFPTRIYNNPQILIDNIFINKFKNENYLVSPQINGLSDHDAKVLILFNIITPDDTNEFYSYRKISKHSLNEFQVGLHYETWEYVNSNNYDDTNTILITFYIPSSGFFMLVFPQKQQTLQNSNTWMTNGIKNSCNNHRKLYLVSRESNDRKLKTHYRNYCKILSKVITAAKKVYYNNKLADSNNQHKTTWSIMKIIINNMKNCNNILMMQIDGKITSHYITLPNYSRKV